MSTSFSIGNVTGEWLDPTQTLVHRMSASHLRWLVALAGVIVAFPACEQEQPEPTALVVDELRRSRLATVADPGGPLLTYPFALALWQDSIAVADVQAAKIVVLPTTLEGGREFGSRGQGPGELQSPQGLAVSGDHLIVYDRGNRRATWFRPDGEHVQSRHLRFASAHPRFGVLGDDRLVVPIGSTEYYAESVSGDGERTAALRRPPGAIPCPERPVPLNMVTANMVVTSPGGVFLVDTENGLIVRWSGDTSPVLDSIPSSLLTSGQRAIDSIIDAEGRDYPCLMPVQVASATDDGLVLWVPGPSRPAGAVLTPSGQWATIEIADGVRDDFPVFPMDVLLVGDELFVATQDGIRVFGVSTSR